ncbi:MAG TPA: O-antigen ligase family protein, partial [Solirubrobacteraceae bacterium]|nr:O-antigen ligase family protein [Solirubrobacteraceae bacterium]
ATASSMRSLSQAPATVPALVVVALFIVWAASEGGYPVTHWAPGALVVLALLVITFVTVPLSLRSVPVAVLVALACLALYTALSYVSILWAGVPGDAWEGANRTLLYLLVFALFALWPQRGSSAALLLCAWTLAMIALAAFVLVHINTISDIGALFGEGRLKYPAGYENAAAATWSMVAWPALLLARSRSIPWPVRGALGGGAVLLADLALLSQSRGALYATPVMLILVFVLVGGRVRTFATLVPIAIGIGLTVPAVLHVRDRFLDGADAKAALHAASAQMLIAALAVGLVVALAGALETRRPPSPELARRLHRGVGAFALTTLAVLLIGGWVAAGDPVARARHAWDTFKSGSGYAANGSGSRLTSGLGSNRYDFYRVALDEFVAHPLGGIGADNFQEQYLAHGRSEETPRYPHSVELRTLTETGLIGAALALGGLAGALLAGWRALRRPDPLVSTVAAAALAGFAYWLVHGSFDWFWEFAGLGAPAFALLGLACALAPRGVPRAAPAAALDPAQAPPPRRPARIRPRAWRTLGFGACALIVLLAAASLAAPYLSALEVQRAVSIWPRAPHSAYSHLQDAARLDPLSDEPNVVAGSIALRFGDLARAEHDFELALGRTPGDAYATLERGAIASASGRRGLALALLARAVRLSPREPLARESLALVKAGQMVDLNELNRAILVKAQQLA